MARRAWIQRQRHLVSLTPLVLSGLLVIGCARMGAIRSQVLDAQTGHPVPGAVVLAVWTKTVGFGLTRTELVGVSEAEVDAEGRFTLERPAGALTADESVTVYKFGYLAWNNEEIFPSFERRQDTGVPNRILLELFPSGISHERHMRFIGRATIEGFSIRPGRPKFDSAIEREDRMR